MTLSGGCTNKNLVRLGGGSLRSLVVLIFVAISAYMTLKGLFAQWRSSWLDPIAIDLSGLGLANASLATLLAGSAAMFWAAARVLEGFNVAGFGAAMIGSIIYSLCGMVIDVAIERIFSPPPA